MQWEVVFESAPNKETRGHIYQLYKKSKGTLPAGRNSSVQESLAYGMVLDMAADFIGHSVDKSQLISRCQEGWAA